MAPHDTNTPKEARRHAFPLIGMAALLIIVLLGFVWWVWYATDDADGPPEEPALQQPVEPAN